MPRQPGFSEDELAAWGGLLQFHARITAQLTIAMEHSHRLGLGEYEVLLKLATTRGGSLLMSRLREITYLTRSPSGLSRLVERLDARGLVVRAPCQTGDRRNVEVAITPAGRTVWRQVSGQHAGRVRALFLDRLEDDELRDLGQTWGRLLAPDGPLGTDVLPS